MIDNAEFRNVINTYRTAIATRQRGTDNSLQTFIVQQRVGIYDLSGDILKTAEETNIPVNHIKITAWEDKEKDFIIQCKNGNITFRRERGYLWIPKSEKMLKNRLNLYETMRRNAYLWSSQYQQDPSDSTLAIIPIDYFNWYEEEPEDLPISATFITCDIAFAGITTPDRTCLCCWGMSDNGMVFLLDVIYDKVPAEDLPTRIIEFYKRNSLRYFNVGNNNKKKVFCGKFYIEDIHNEALLPFLKKEIQCMEVVKRGGNTKAMRITEALPVIAQKVVYLPKKRFFKEMTGIKEELRQLTPALLGQVRDDFTDTLCDCINYGRQSAFRVAKFIKAYELYRNRNTNY